MTAYYRSPNQRKRPSSLHNSYETQASIVLIVLLLAYDWGHKSLQKTIKDYALWSVMAMLAILFISRLAGRLIGQSRSSRLKIRDIDSLNGLEFERYIAKLLKAHGYKNVKLTERYDLGIDITAQRHGIKWGIQVKRYSGSVNADAVRQAVAALNLYGCEKAMVITNSYFSQPAKQLARSNNCVLIDRQALFRKAV